MERLAEHAAGPARGGGGWLARPNDDRREPRRATVEVALARVVVHQQLADRLRHAVGRLRRQLRAVGVRVPHRLAAEARDAAREDHAWAAGHRARRLEDMPSAVE